MSKRAKGRRKKGGGASPAHGAEKHAGGRPPEIAQEHISGVETALRAGNYIEDAAAYIGIAKSTLYLWMKRGRQEKTGLYRQFVDAAEKGLGAAVVHKVGVISRAAAGVFAPELDANGKVVVDAAGEPVMKCIVRPEWTAAAWWLERKFPENWGRKQRVELGGIPASDGGEPVRVQIYLPKETKD